MSNPRRLRPAAPIGLLAWLEQTRIILPLKGVECRFQVQGALASVELDQIFQQDNSRPLDCVYTFPLPAGAAVYRCEVEINGRTICARVQERGEAQRIFREQKAAGRRAAMVETERENLFTLSLGNVQPGDLLVVQFAWFQTLERTGEELRLLVPTCPGVRYIPGPPLLRSPSGRGVEMDTHPVPDASRITPPRMDRLHPDGAYFSLRGEISAADAEPETVSSPSHALCLRRGAGTVSIELSSQAEVPDRDLVCTWHEPAARTLSPHGWSWREGAEQYALVQLRAPAEVPRARTGTQDFYFLVDRSGSMQGRKWEATCEAVAAFVQLLASEDRVWITLFESAYLDFAEAPMPAPQVLKDEGFRRMAALGVGGGTELLPAARHVLEQIARHSPGRRAIVILVTDGQVGNEREIEQAFVTAPHALVHTFGIDTAVNDAFLKGLARQQRGHCWLRTPDDDIAGTIAALGERLQRPVLTDLNLRGAWQAPVAALPDLHAREVITLPLRGPGVDAVELRALDAEGREHTLHVDVTAPGSEAIKLLWVRERIAGLLHRGETREAIALAVRHNILCEGAAFIAWDEAEQVAVATEELVQPCFTGPVIGACAAPLASVSSRPRGAGFHRMSFGGADPNPGEPRAEEQPPVPEPIDLAASLRRVMFKPEEIEALTTWAAAVPAAAAERAEALLSLVRLMPMLAGDDHLRGLFAFMGKILLQRALALRDDFPAWLRRNELAWTILTQFQKDALAAGAPSSLVVPALRSLIQEEGIDRDRLGKMMEFARLQRVPFSSSAQRRHWEAVFGPTELVA